MMFPMVDRLRRPVSREHVLPDDVKPPGAPCCRGHPLDAPPEPTRVGAGSYAGEVVCRAPSKPVSAGDPRRNPDADFAAVAGRQATPRASSGRQQRVAATIPFVLQPPLSA